MEIVVTEDLIIRVKGDLEVIYDKLNYRCMNLPNYYQKDSLIDSYKRLSTKVNRLKKEKGNYVSKRFLIELGDEMNHLLDRIEKC